jgi:hypothetical protein
VSHIEGWFVCPDHPRLKPVEYRLRAVRPDGEHPQPPRMGRDGTVVVDPLDDAPGWPAALADVEASPGVVDGNVDANRNYEVAIR